MSTVLVFLNETTAPDGIGLALINPSIIEHGGNLTPGVKLSRESARQLRDALEERIRMLDEENSPAD